MPSDESPRVAIVDVGIGNLFSVHQACSRAGMRGEIVSGAAEILAADAVLLPGMGSFGDAMASLQRQDLVAPLRDFVASGRHLIGICLGLQLLLDESHEFGRHRGLGLVPGSVVRFDGPVDGSGRKLKVPLVGWRRISPPPGGGNGGHAWDGTPLRGVDAGTYMYFVHSYYARPDDDALVLSSTQYGNIVFCSGLRSGNVYGFQFHPERSGPKGLRVYEELRSMIVAAKGRERSMDNAGDDLKGGDDGA